MTITGISPQLAKFIACACDLRKAVWDFTLPDVQFEELYDCTKQEAEQQILQLQRQINILQLKTKSKCFNAQQQLFIPAKVAKSF